MNTPDPSSVPPLARDVGERNVERLLNLAYRPEVPDPDFVRRLTEQLQEAARQQRASSRPAPAPRAGRPYRLWSLAAVAALIGLAFGLHSLLEPASGFHPPAAPSSQAASSTAPANEPQEAVALQLTPRPRPPSPPVQPLALGESVQTRAGERRRLALPDGSVLYLNQNTSLTLTGERQLTLSRGEIFTEVAPREPGQDGATFVVRTPQREVAALGTKFEVNAQDNATGVLVTQGKVRVSGLNGVVRAGQELPPGGEQAVAAPRATHVLDWTRELMVAAESPLVPHSQYAGGALVAVDPTGQEVSLSLRKYHIDVHIEDGFARTTIDQTYFNHESTRLEGTFYFPLPPDASLSRLAMYVDGNLMEGGMAERDFARNVFESIVRRQRDPALLEWVDGSTFKMRVFPLEGRQEKRIILSYTQKLNALYGRSQYRFPAGHNLDQVRDWSFHALVKDGASLQWHSDSHSLKATTHDRDLVLDGAAREVKLDRDVVLELTDKTLPARDTVRFSSAEHEGNRYLMLRYRPALPGKAQRQRRDWVFLFESSGDRDPLLARAQVEMVRTLLQNAEHDDTFSILTAGTEVHAYAAEPKPATVTEVKAALDYLDHTHLVGALDLGKALETAAPLLKAAKNPYLVHVGSGIAALGERRTEVLARQVPEGTTYVGVAVGKHWSQQFMKAAADRSNGYVTQINPDEPVGWRAFDLFATLNTPRLLDVKVVDDAEKASFLTMAGTLAQGEELCALTRVQGDQPLPESVSISGTVDGKPFRKELPVKDVAAHADYLPRTWARREIDRLLAENAAGNKERIVALSKAMYVMTPFTSLLVLENDAMYTQYNVDRGRKDHWALYPCPEKIPVVYEPLPGQGGMSQGAAPAPPGQRPAPEEVLRTLWVRVPARVLSWASQGNPANAPRVLTALQLQLAAFAVPEPAADASAPTPNVSNGMTPPAVDWVMYYRNHGYQINANGDAGQRIQYAPVFVSPTMQWAMPNSGLGMPLYNYFPTTGTTTTTASTPMPPMGGAVPPGGFPGPVGQVSPYSNTNGNMPVGTPGLPVPVMGNVGWSGGYGPAAGLMVPPVTLPSRGTNGRPAQQQSATQGAGQQPAQAVPGGGIPSQMGGFGGGGFPGGFGGFQGGFGGGGGFQGGGFGTNPTFWHEPAPRATANQPVADTGPDPLALDYGFFPPAHALVVRGTSRIYNCGRIDQGQSQRSLFGRIILGPQADTADYLAARLLRDLRPVTPHYERPTCTHDDRIFFDLLAYAPGMNTSHADILATLETESSLNSEAPGKIDPAARRLIEQARASGWQTVAVPGTDGKPSFTLVCKGSGQYASVQMLPEGLTERQVCDGKTLLTLYPDLGLGARRTVSRFHRAELTELVPWVLPPVEDLVHGADVRCVDDRTVAVVPRGSLAPCLQLIFAEDGRLAERRLVERPDGKVLGRETYSSTGTVKVLDSDGKELAVRKFAIQPAQAPDLKPDTSSLVVLPLPFRTREQIVAARGLTLQPANNPPAAYRQLKENVALELIGSTLAAGNEELRQIISARFLDDGDRRAGFSTLLATLGTNLDSLPVPDRQVNAPLAKYLGWLKHRGEPSEPTDLSGLGDGLLRRLIEFHELSQPWQSPQQTAISTTETKRLLAFLSAGKSPDLTWALADVVLQNQNRPMDYAGGLNGLKRKVLAAAARSLEGVPELGYIARYEQARFLLHDGDRDTARKLFLELYEHGRQQGVLPVIDGDFRQALLGADAKSTAWDRLMVSTADGLLSEHSYGDVLTLAWQCVELDDQHLADELVSRLLAQVGTAPERLPVSVAALEYLWHTSQYQQADTLVASLLANNDFARRPSLWRLGAKIAAQRNQPQRRFECLARALELEYRDLPEVIDLEMVRHDYAALLGHYEEMAGALALLQQQPPRDFLVRVVSAADRWRALDSDGTAACQAAARILKKVGFDDLAWDYLTTPLGGQANEPTAVLQLARTLGQQGDRELAERAYQLAVVADPANAEIRTERAANLQQAGRPDEARQLLRPSTP